MNNISLLGVCLCLFTGAMLGVLYLLGRLLRLLLRGGWLMQAAVDLAFCLCFAVVAFTCALALDKGRLRFIQLALQVLGAWAAVAALGPLVGGAVRLLRRCGGWLRRMALKLTGRLLQPLRVFWNWAISGIRRRIPKPKPRKRRAKRRSVCTKAGNQKGVPAAPPPPQTGSTR